MYIHSMYHSPPFCRGDNFQSQILNCGKSEKNGCLGGIPAMLNICLGGLLCFLLKKDLKKNMALSSQFQMLISTIFSQTTC